MTPTAGALAFSCGLALLILALAPGAARSVFAPTERVKSVRERVSLALRTAGIFDKTPTFVIIGLLGAMVAGGIILGVLVGSVYAGFGAVILVPAIAHFALMSRQRSFMNRAADELVPFLNRISTAAASGRPISAAYVEAVEDAKELKPLLAQSAANITAGMSFREAIVETIENVPMRMWSVFVRQMEAHAEAGGDLATAIQKTIEQVGAIVMLQAEARADYATQSRQQKLIVIVVIGGISFFTFAVNPQIMSVLWTTTAGIIALIMGGCVMGSGLWLSRKQMKDIEKKLNF